MPGVVSKLLTRWDQTHGQATNTSRGNDPYDLECEESGDTITWYFSNGGWIEADIDSHERSEGGWTISATDSKREQ